MLYDFIRTFLGLWNYRVGEQNIAYQELGERANKGIAGKTPLWSLNSPIFLLKYN